MIINEITSNINQNIHIFNTSITSPIINTISQNKILTFKNFFSLFMKCNFDYIVFINLVNYLT